MTRDFDVFNVSGIKHRVMYRQNCWFNEVWLRFENYQQGENTSAYLWFPILNPAFSIQNYNFSLLNYNLNKNLLIYNL